MHEWFHWFTFFLWAVYTFISWENSVRWWLTDPILIYRISHSNLPHLSTEWSHDTSNLVIVDITLPLLIGISYLKKLVLVHWVLLSKWIDLVRNIISKLRALICDIIIIECWLSRCSSTLNHVGVLVVLKVVYHFIVHSLVISWWHHYNLLFIQLLLLYIL